MGIHAALFADLEGGIVYGAGSRLGRLHGEALNETRADRASSSVRKNSMTLDGMCLLIQMRTLF